jgi:hypothetical protein
LDATQAIVRRQVDTVQRAWRHGLAERDLESSFLARVAPIILAAIAQGQIDAAELARSYVDDAMDAADAGPREAAPSVLPAAFSGATALGAPLVYLADVLLSRMLADIAAGMSLTDANLTGLRRALTVVGTEISDAGRTAAQVQMTADTRVAGHERVVKVPACDRCIVLAGKFYRYSSAFLRHPRCDCTMLPVTEQQWHEENPQNTPGALFDAMSEAEQNRRFGTANADAIRLGADISQVVNARQGMSTVQAFGRTVQVTTSGTTKRALYGGYEIREDGTLRKRADAELVKKPGRRYRVARAPRLTPGQIFRLGREFGWDREELVRQLRRFAYLI